MEYLKQVGIFIICWLIGIPIAFFLSWWWEFPATILIITVVSFIVGLIIRFIPQVLDELV